MTDYNDLITRLRSMDGIGDIQLNELMNRKTPMVAADAIAELVDRVAYLESRLEVTPEHDIDGIAARDATIKLQDGRIAELKSECSELRGMAGAMDMFRSEMIDSGVIDINVPPMFFSESVIPRLLRLADMEKQEPVAWLVTDENINSLQIESILRLIDRSKHAHTTDIKLRINGKDEWYEADWIKHMKRSAPIPTQGEVTVITQHEPVTTVEDRYNADGKSCHITDDLPAGMPLYAAPPAAAPVRLTDENIDRALSERVPGGSEVRDWFLPHDTDRGHANILTVVRAIETFILRANGFKVEGEQ